MTLIQRIRNKVDIQRLPYLVADLIGGFASASLFSVLHMAGHVSGPCSGNVYKQYCDLTFSVISFLIYLSVTSLVWAIHRELPYQMLSGRLNWTMIGFVGLFLCSSAMAILEADQCSLSLADSLQKGYLGAFRLSFVFLLFFLVPFFIALFVELVINDLRGRRLK